MTEKNTPTDTSNCIEAKYTPISTILEGSSNYIAAKFRDILLSEFGWSKTGEEHPFLKLKRVALDSSVLPEDRMQAVRYMVTIPYINMIEYATEAAKSIIQDDGIPINERYFFFSNGEKYSKLEGNVIRNCHVYFFSLGESRNYPVIYRLLSARVIYCDVSHNTTEWKESRRFIIESAKDKDQKVSIRAEAADILLTHITNEDFIIGKGVIAELGNLYSAQESSRHSTIYTDSQNAHNEAISDHVMNIIKKLSAEKHERECKDKLLDDRTISSFSEEAEGQKREYTTGMIHEYLSKIVPPNKKDKVLSALNHILIYTGKYEGLTLSDILVLIWTKIQSQSRENIKRELEQRMIEELYDMEDTCGTGYLSRIVNVMSGFGIEEDNDQLEIRMSFKTQLRANIFARIQTCLRLMPQDDQEIILKEIADVLSNKENAKQFLELCDIRTELESEFVKSGYMKEDEFNLQFESTVGDFLGV